MSENFDELQQLFNTLKQYVDDYFKNLDVQEEINKKLDLMSKDGTLERLIGNFITNNKIGNVINYGADSSGVTDSTDSIIKCASENKTIFFPNGTYLIMLY